jgi:NAD-dependent dihydropyrimidine dehydrogenase PreA subunit
MTVGSDHYLVNAKILFARGKNNANDLRENITDGAIELLQLPLYNIDSLEDESTSFLYKKGLDEKLGESNFESTEVCYQHLVKCIHQAAKEALGENILRSKTKPVHVRDKFCIYCYLCLPLVQCTSAALRNSCMYCVTCTP